MSDSTEPDIQNPMCEGEYLVYGDAERMPKGGWAGFYRIEHHPEGQPLLKVLVKRTIVNYDSHKTADIAKLHAVSYGLQLLREQLGKV